MIDLYEEICKQVLKLDFTAHGIMKSLSESKSYRLNDYILYNYRPISWSRAS
jgi:hypothetical protein